MPSPSEVTAVIVTRGDTDLWPIIDSLIFEDIVIWDNSREAHDEKTYGRVLATLRARNPIIYSQDDDIIHTAVNRDRRRLPPRCSDRLPVGGMERGRERARNRTRL